MKAPVRFSHAITLVELLVAMSVLALVLVLVAQVVNSILASTRIQNQQLDSMAAARRALDVLESDLRSAVISNTASILTGAGDEPGLAFLTKRRGPVDSVDHRYLAVNYQLDADGGLRRDYGSVGFEEPDLLTAAVSDIGPGSVVARGVLKWQMRALTSSGMEPLNAAATSEFATVSYNGLPVPQGREALIVAGPTFATNLPSRVSALEIWIAAVDEQTFTLLEESGGLNVARTALGAEPELWRAELDAAEINPTAKSSARILRKTISLP